MPKAMQYTKGSIIYFEGDHDERIFIMQQGAVLLTSTDIESGQPVAEQVKSGEFFGVKSALGHFRREETATALVPTVAVALTIQEFEILFSNNKALIMKMLRVFSNQLRQIHKKTESILNNVQEDQQTGMIAVANSFYDDEEFRSACDVYMKFMKRYPNSPQIPEIQKKYNDAKLRADKLAALNRNPVVDYDDEGGNSSLKLFSLPAFERFAKTYEPGEVIIAEYEPGDSFYLIQSGRVQLVKCVNGSKKNLDVLKPGEFFGEMAILDNSARSATCMAAGKVKCLEFNKENFELLITGNPQMALLLLKLFCKRIYDQKRRFKILVIKDLQARIADVFMLLDEMNPVMNEAEKQRRFNVTISDVAHWAGLNAEVTRDEINKFVERRKIEVYENYIVVNNINDMKRTVDTRGGARGTGLN
ncbi:cAMP-binding domain of CRP or a regulatory subunit of cAMP-dependent protein kinases [Treponema bryantii]|uniref:cAMP-binding domain of CRP or a regulatory subunit of cAMP-dependent protein kinases n=1 Tax=Treponema bryantii TaxID=163 RepID=A0A1I3N8V0_9SPIR|nr:Crp/Fnr family transcriptional regulator [Treponema bryantii]SFJ05545.1 cAMP-binding domain of CRP or a regulatory subunit of cAMP-dependent protein kinases [Treponema bryantii]